MKTLKRSLSLQYAGGYSTYSSSGPHSQSPSHPPPSLILDSANSCNFSVTLFAIPRVLQFCAITLRLLVLAICTKNSSSDYLCTSAMNFVTVEIRIGNFFLLQDLEKIVQVHDLSDNFRRVSWWSRPPQGSEDHRRESFLHPLNDKEKVGNKV